MDQPVGTAMLNPQFKAPFYLTCPTNTRGSDSVGVDVASQKTTLS